MKTADPARLIAQVPFSARPGTFDDRLLRKTERRRSSHGYKIVRIAANIATTIVTLRRALSPDNAYNVQVSLTLYPSKLKVISSRHPSIIPNSDGEPLASPRRDWLFAASEYASLRTLRLRSDAHERDSVKLSCHKLDDKAVRGGEPLIAKILTRRLKDQKQHFQVQNINRAHSTISPSTDVSVSRKQGSAGMHPSRNDVGPF